ncbi:hypothetical protein ACFPH6_20645 [Streptomyces xiangluensis]|uniref:Uncharacterized protein n=1 Tax=Streptomyces xiangluensis TaxID=2665720 RepID=A0ABV8YUS7_9ACTN
MGAQDDLEGRWVALAAVDGAGGVVGDGGGLHQGDVAELRRGWVGLSTFTWSTRPLA